MEVTQFTYFQQVGGFDLAPISVEYTYGIERLAMYLQGVDNVYDLDWNGHIRYGDVHHQGEVEYSKHNFEHADIPMLFRLFETYEDESRRLAELGLVLPSYDYCLKCSHTFNLLEAQELYIDSLKTLGIDPLNHDIRFVEDDWESPTLGAWGIGWEVWLDGMEVTQFTYFQQVGGFDLAPISVEYTYGIERLAMYLQGVDNVYDLDWNGHVRYGDVHHQGEVEYSKHNFEHADIPMLFKLFDTYEEESRRLTELGLVLPGYDYCLKCSHTFNLLEARGAISVAERTRFIGRVRALARETARLYVEQRQAMGHPLMGRWENGL